MLSSLGEEYDGALDRTGRTAEGTQPDAGRRLERRGAPAGARPRRRAEARPRAARRPAAAPGPHARNDFRQAVDEDARLLRGGHLPAWRRRAPPLELGATARPRRADSRHGAGALAL